MIRIYAVLDDLQAGANLRSVLRCSPGGSAGPHLVFAGDWEGLREEVACRSVDVAVVDPWAGGARPLVSGTLGFLGEHLGYGRVVFYLSRARCDSNALAEMGRAGFSSVPTVGLDDDPRALRRALGNAAAQVFLDQVMARLDGRLKPDTRTFLAAVLAAAIGTERVDELARALLMDLRSLRTRTRALGLPYPRDLLRWGRLIQAFGFSRMGVGSVIRLAYHTGYCDPGSLCRLFRELLGHPAGEVPQTDAERLVAEGILTRMGGGSQWAAGQEHTTVNPPSPRS